MKNILEKSFHFLLPLLFIFPLFKESISSAFFIGLSINTVIHSIVTKSYKNFNYQNFYYCIPFFIVFVFISFDFFSKGNLKQLNRALFFLLFPIIFSLIPKSYFAKEKLDFYFTLLKNSCLIIAVGFIIAFLWTYDFADFFVYKYGIPKFRDFVYYEINFFIIHPTYYTAIVVFCTAYSFEKVLNEKKYWEILYVFSFVLITFLVLAKINIVYMAILFVIMLLFRSSFSITQKIASVLAFALIGLSLISFIPGVKKRFTEMVVSYKNPPKGLAFDSTNIRLSISECSYEIAKENYLFGVGFENLPKELNKCFAKNYDSSFYKNHQYLTHNYFFFIFLSTGLIGLLALLFYWYKVFRIPLKINSFLLYVVTINVVLISCTEDFFIRHYGIFYFNLILMTFINFYQNQKLLENKKSF